MSITHDWKITRLVQKNDETGTVIKVNYKLHSSYDVCSYIFAGSVDLECDNIQNFVSYQNLTEELVVQWVHDKLGEEVTTIEQGNEYFINSSLNLPIPSTKVERLPWEPEPTPEPTPDPIP